MKWICYTECAGRIKDSNNGGSEMTEEERKTACEKLEELARNPNWSDAFLGGMVRRLFPYEGGNE